MALCSTSRDRAREAQRPARSGDGCGAKINEHFRIPLNTNLGQPSYTSRHGGPDSCAARHNPAVGSIETIHWHTLHPRYLGPHSRVLDLGANYGHFSRCMVERFNCECIAVEPSPEPFARMYLCGRTRKLPFAIGRTAGQVRFHVRKNALASSIAESNGDDVVASVLVDAITLEQLLDKLGWETVDLLKVDIEGAEVEVFAGASDATLKRIRQMTIEFHDFCGFTASSVVKATLHRLHALGFDHVRMSRVGHQDTWLINRALCDISTLELLYIKAFVRNWYGLLRVVRRNFVAM